MVCRIDVFASDDHFAPSAPSVSSEFFCAGLFTMDRCNDAHCAPSKKIKPGKPEPEPPNIPWGSRVGGPGGSRGGGSAHADTDYPDVGEGSQVQGQTDTRPSKNLPGQHHAIHSAYRSHHQIIRRLRIRKNKCHFLTNWKPCGVAQSVFCADFH